MKLAKKFMYLIFVLLCISFLSFVLANIDSVDPAEAYARRLNKSASEETIQQLRKDMGFDKHILKQYFLWLGKVIRLDFGNSYITHKPVLKEMLNALPVTIILASFSAFFILLFSVPLGIISALHVGTRVDKLVEFFSFLII